MSENSERASLIAGGFSDGERILIPDVKNSAEVFMLLFHEIGHNIDNQFDTKQVIRPLEEVKTETIKFTDEEAEWLKHESQTGWASTGISEHHRSILSKLLKLMLVDKSEVKSDIRSLSVDNFNQVLSKSVIYGSEQVPSGQSPPGQSDESDTTAPTSEGKNHQQVKLSIVDQKLHRNSEAPADFVMELLFDVLNCSINEHFSLPTTTRIFTTFPDERNEKTTKIARYLIKKGWRVPGFYSQLKNEEQQ